MSVSYDGNGNLLNDGAHNYTWDGNWGIPSTIDSVSLTYDALGRMVEQNRGGNYTQVVYSPSGAKLALMNQQTLSKAFVPLPGGATAVYTNGSNGVSLTYYRHPDWLGSSRLATTPGRTVYSYSAYAPFGENYGTAVSPQGSDLSFTGQNQDTVSGLYDFPFREYSPAQGRWISPDPAGPNAVDPTNPQSWNRYAYVGNSPLSSIDPYGLRDCLALDGSGSVLHNCVDTSSQNPDDVDPANPGGVPGILGGCVRLIIDGQFSGYIYVGPGNPAPGTPCARGGTLPGLAAGSGGTSTPANNCVSPSKVQSFVIPHVALPAAQHWNKTVVWGLGGSGGAGFGKGIGAVGSLSAQIAVSPNGNAAYLITSSAPAAVAGPLGTYPAVTPSTKGLSILGGPQFGFSNATDPSQLGGTSIDASGSIAAGIGIGGDASLGAGGTYQATVTLGFGAGGRGSAGALTNTTVVPICRTW